VGRLIGGLIHKWTDVSGYVEMSVIMWAVRVHFMNKWMGSRIKHVAG
jgi:hypothetical protein